MAKCPARSVMEQRAPTVVLFDQFGQHLEEGPMVASYFLFGLCHTALRRWGSTSLDPAYAGGIEQYVAPESWDRTLSDTILMIA